jgi:hypothetical protein
MLSFQIINSGRGIQIDCDEEGMATLIGRPFRDCVLGRGGTDWRGRMRVEERYYRGGPRRVGV